MLEEVGPEMKPGPGGGFIASADKRPAQDHLMLAVEARGTEVVVDPVDAEPLQGMEVILAPMPDVAEDIVKPSGVGR